VVDSENKTQHSGSAQKNTNDQTDNPSISGIAKAVNPAPQPQIPKQKWRAVEQRLGDHDAAIAEVAKGKVTATAQNLTGPMPNTRGKMPHF
jgi:hypothetical protein